MAHDPISASATGLSDDALKARLDAADAACAAAGMKFTPVRRKVLEVLLAADAPMKAYDILPKLEDAGAQKPPTVYRALEFLLQAGFAHRLESENAFVACDHAHPPELSAASHSAGFLICDGCGRSFELPQRDVGAPVRALAEAAGFVLDRLIVEGRGLCATCAG